MKQFCGQECNATEENNCGVCKWFIKWIESKNSQKAGQRFITTPREYSLYYVRPRIDNDRWEKAQKEILIPVSELSEHEIDLIKIGIEWADKNPLEKRVRVTDLNLIDFFQNSYRDLAEKINNLEMEFTTYKITHEKKKK